MDRLGGFKNPFTHSPFHKDPGAHCRACGWEAGADAILEALRNQESSYSEDSYLTPFKMEVTSAGQTAGLRDTYGETTHCKGVWIFIPEQEE